MERLERSLDFTHISELAKDFFGSFPPDGIAIHGTTEEKLDSIRKIGIVKKTNSPIHYYSFRAVDDKFLNLSTQGGSRVAFLRFYNTVIHCIDWAIRNSQNFENPYDIKPAIVIASRPTIRSINYSGSNFWNLEQTTYNILPNKLIYLASLTEEEIVTNRSLLGKNADDSWDGSISIEKRNIGIRIGTKIIEHFVSTKHLDSNGTKE